MIVLAWNIERFGARYGGWPNPDVMEDMRCMLIAKVAIEKNADVIVIQELRAAGVLLLEKLRSILDQSAMSPTWRYDWIHGALTSVPQIVKKNSDTGTTTTTNLESYGVLWRGKTLVPPAQPCSQGNMMTLVSEGKRVTMDPKDIPIKYDPRGPVGPLGFPQAAAAKIVSTDGSGMTRRSGLEYSNDDILNMLAVRRPCCVSLNLHGRPTNLVVYHAPVSHDGSYYGTLAALASDALNLVDTTNPYGLPRGFFAGDFNVANSSQQEALLGYTTSLGYGINSYRDGQPPASSVNFVPPCFGRQPDRFLNGQSIYTDARDYGFARGVAGVVIDLVKIPDTFVNGTGTVWSYLTDRLLAPFFQDFFLQITALEQNEKIRQGTGDLVRFLLNGAARNRYPDGTDQYTAAAILYRLLISDHLPVIITIP